MYEIVHVPDVIERTVNCPSTAQTVGVKDFAEILATEEFGSFM